MNRLHLATLIAVSSVVLAGSSWAQAVTVDATSLMKRLDAIEAKMNTLQGHKGSATASTNGAASGYSAADLEQRMEDLETESSQVRGGNDRAIQAIESLAKKFDGYVKDMDMRMGDIETRMDELSKKQAATAAAPVAETPAVAATPATDSAVVPAAGAAPAASKSATPVPVGLSAADHYNKAYAYLTATDYKNAQLWFEEFLKRHPTDALADNAYYWLGEVYLVQNNPAAAVGKFRDGIKAFPKGSKVTANLFKMGVALEQLKQPKLAQAAWSKLLKDYPTAPEAARAKDKLLQLKQTAPAA